MRAGVTCTSFFANYKAWKWRLAKKNHYLVPELVTYTLNAEFQPCTSFSNYTAWKWQLEKKNHDLAPELAAYALTSPPCEFRHQVVVLFLQLPLSSCVVRKACTCYTSLHNTYWHNFSHVSHQWGHNSLSPRYSVGHEFGCQVMVLFLQSPLSSCVVSKACTSYSFGNLCPSSTIGESSSLILPGPRGRSLQGWCPSTYTFTHAQTQIYAETHKHMQLIYGKRSTHDWHFCDTHVHTHTSTDINCQLALLYRSTGSRVNMPMKILWAHLSIWHLRHRAAFKYLHTYAPTLADMEAHHTLTFVLFCFCVALCISCVL